MTALRFATRRRAARALALPVALAASTLSAPGCSSSSNDETTSASSETLGIPHCVLPEREVCDPITGGGGTQPMVRPELTPQTVGANCYCVNYGAATFTPAREYGVQPGWSRATFGMSVVGTNSFALTGSVTCAAPTSPDSVTVGTTQLSGVLAAVDIRANTSWLAANGFPTPCVVTSVTINATNQPYAIGSGTFTNAFPTDVPLGSLTPRQLPENVTGASVSLQPPAAFRRYFAYPPIIVAIQSASGHVAFAEVEEQASRGTVGVRGVASFVGYSNELDRELGGGAEIYPGWGIDIDLLGITKATSGTEESNPGHNFYTSPAPGAPSLYYGDPGGPVYPAPPTYSESVYLADVLDNRAVPRCSDPNGCLDVVYDATAHTLNAINGATVSWIEGGPVQPGVTASPQVVSLTPKPTTTTTSSAPAIGASVAMTVSGAPLRVTTRPARRATPSPQETVAAVSATPLLGAVQSGAGGGCPLSGTTSSVPLTQCSGNSSAFPCPTSADPLRVDTLPFASPPSIPNQLSLSAMMPQYAGRSNEYGTCGSHAATQEYELLVNKLAADLAPIRSVTVDGQAIAIPNPLIAYSVGGGLTNQWNWGGTKAGDEDIDPSMTAPPAGSHNMPPWLNGYWPAYEQDWNTWTLHPVTDPRGTAALARCHSQGYWWSGYCVGQGQPPPGAYWSYSQLLASTTALPTPFSDAPWSLADTYFDTSGVNLSLANRDTAIQEVITYLTNGLPVLMSLKADSVNVTDTAGHSQSLLGDTSWFLPPELADCTAAQISSAFQPYGGHDVDIIGYSIVGTPAAPDLFRSYFIIDNNWGKGTGYGGYYTMNFAAFKFLAGGLSVGFLDCPYNSIVCTNHGG